MIVRLLPRSAFGWLAFAARAAAAAVAITRLARAATTAPPVTMLADDARLSRRDSVEAPSVSVVIPARDEAMRIAPLLDAVVGAPGVSEVIVVDDQSSDDTAAIAARSGARVVSVDRLPAGWAGKAWAVQCGVEAAHTEWVVTLDADCRPDPSLPSSVAARAATDGLDLLTVAGRFQCPTPATRWLHASMLTTLVYRFGSPGASMPAGREMANGQCMAMQRDAFLAWGGMGAVAGEVVEDIALARAVAARGGRVGFLDASELLTVRMFESAGDVWHGWGRSIALPGVEPRRRQLFDLAVVVLAQALPLMRVLARRADVVDMVMVANRVGTLIGTRRAYERADAAYWLSPLADSVSVVALARGIARRGRQTWRGRTYG